MDTTTAKRLNRCWRGHSACSLVRLWGPCTLVPCDCAAYGSCDSCPPSGFRPDFPQWCACCGVEDPEPDRTIGANCIEAGCLVPVACSVPLS